MPLYFGHKNHKGLSVSPLLQARGLDMLRAPPHAVRAIACPLVTQHGYSAYLSNLPAFLKAYNDQSVIYLNKQGYPATFPTEQCIDIGHPPLVIDYNGPIPSKHTETLSDIGFERIKMQRTDNILRFPTISLYQVRLIRGTSPNEKTPSPNNTVNLDAFGQWILVLRLISNLLAAHTYPAFRDDAHFTDELPSLTNGISRKRGATDNEALSSKRQKGEEGHLVPDVMEVEDNASVISAPESTIRLSKAKPPSNKEKGWGTPLELPNASGLFFPYIPELASYDDTTVPNLIETYLVQSLGDTPERQVARLDRIRAAWGLISKTDVGNIMAHMCQVIRLALTSQARAFPLVADGIYEGCVLSGARFFVGLHGQVYRPLSFDKLQEEAGSYSTHGNVLREIVMIVDEDKDASEFKTMRQLREYLLAENSTEEDRDQIRRLAVNLHFPGDKFLAVNSQTVMKVIDDLRSDEVLEDSRLPMHHSALYSRDRILVALSAFGYQAPSFQIDNCPKVTISNKAPTTLVMRQKSLDVATLDWKKMLESKEMRNNPRNLSRANRDRTVVGNDKTQLWGKMIALVGESGGVEKITAGDVGQEQEGNDGLDDW